MHTTTVPFNKLRLSESNVRKANGEAGLEALAASIAEHGLLQPLIVSPAKGRRPHYDVHAGGRRWRAIGILVERGVFSADHAVDVRLCESEQAATREISLAENLIREAMAPTDEARAYADIVAEGADPEAVSRRFGVTVRHVQGRLRLADLAPPIFAALGAGEITLDVAMAYGSTGDRDRQEAAWDRLSMGWQSDNPQAIRRAIAEDTLSASHPVARFLGETEYLACGGRIERDLFSNEGEGLWLDGDLAMDLAGKKLAFDADIAALASRLAWVKPCLASHVPHDEIAALRPYWPLRAEPEPEVAVRITTIIERLDDIMELFEEAGEGDEAALLEAERQALEAEHDSLVQTELLVPDADRPHVGTFLVLGRGGEPRLLDVWYTTAPPEHAEIAPPRGQDVAESQAAQWGLPKSLGEQLAKDRRDVLALRVAQDPVLAFDLAIFALARDLAGHCGAADTGCAIRISDRAEPAGLSGTPVSAAGDALAAFHAGLPSDWARNDDSFTAFLAFRALDREIKANWLAFAVALSLQVSLATGRHALAFQNSLGAAIGIDVAQHWRPSVEGFFDRLRKGQILAILGDLDPELPSRYANTKKADLAVAAARLCAGDTIIEPAIKARALAWVPEVMRFAGFKAAADHPGADVDPGADLGGRHFKLEIDDPDVEHVPANDEAAALPDAA